MKQQSDSLILFISLFSLQLWIEKMNLKAKYPLYNK